MNDFLQDAFEPLIISRTDLERIVLKLLELWPENIACGQKEFGPNSFTSRTLTEQGRVVRRKFEDVNWGDNTDIAAVAMDFVGLAIKVCSKYLTVVHPNEIDIEMVIYDISARDDIVVTET
ncbi:MAG: hypothetical protein ABJO01_02230 [Parasphingorhabdus sp.]|uniref:hypothetical protein n=1 Tax=Parasphingorhabdus sp. TaxID=2709688 RepID=UPI003297CD08